MTEPLPSKPPTDPGVTKRPKGGTPDAPHQPFDEQTTASFAAWMDLQLADLEDRFHYMATPGSIMASIRR